MIRGNACRRFSLIALCVLASGIGAVARAQTSYPVRPVTIVVPLQAGTASDLVARVLAEQVAQKLGQQFVVENIVGAGGQVGAQRVVRAKPDGYVLGAFNNGVHAILPFSNVNLPFDPMKDLVAITLLAKLPSVLIVNPESPAKTLQAFVELARQSPGKLTYASVGVGSPQHLAMEQLKADAGFEALHVPYRGGAQATLAVSANEVNAFWIATSVALPFIRDGRVRAVAVGGRARTATLPEVPTVIEAGVPNYEYVPWLALFAPSGTPAPVLEQLRQAFAEVLGQPEIKGRLASHGLDAESSSGDELTALIVAERARTAPLIRRIGLAQ
jgi:tripartite-type tricarboxylate transporter receptor subunit TctC